MQKEERRKAYAILYSIDKVSPVRVWRHFYLILVLGMLFSPQQLSSQSSDYLFYHERVVSAEELLARENFDKALEIYDSIIEDFKYVYLREYQVASQLAFLIGDKEKGVKYIHLGILQGWSLKSIKSCSIIADSLSTKEWKIKIRREYSTLKREHQKKLESPLALLVRKMIKKDQRKAFGAFIRFPEENRIKYSERVFLPHSKKQIASFLEIMESNHFPGERLIGNNYWMSTILSHHNSISRDFNQSDTLYPYFRDILLDEIKAGYLSPYVFAIIDEWYASMFDRPAYGILIRPKEDSIESIDLNRDSIGMRSILLRNKLLDVEKTSNLNLYLDIGNWLVGKIDL